MTRAREHAMGWMLLAALPLLGGWQPGALSAEHRRRVQPLLDTPLRDAAICRGHDGAYYLTGTVAGPEGGFQNNDGIWLWRSTDLADWKPLGQVWSIAKDAAGPRSRWQLARRVNPDDPAGPLVRGMTSPEVHALRGSYYITYSMNAAGTGLLKSTSGRPGGPYVDLGRMTAEGSDASLFADSPAEDGDAPPAVYWVVGQGWIARMKPDLSGLAERLRLLRVAPDEPRRGHGPEGTSPHSPRTIGRAGAHLFKAGGRYWLCAADVRGRLGVGCYDTFVAGSDTLAGPYSRRHMMIPHGGQVTVFPGPDDGLRATFAGRDCRAAFRDRPGAVALRFDKGVLYGQAARHPFPRLAAGTFTEFGPWARIEAVAPVHIRDLQFTMAPDGYAYLTGSGTDESYAGKIMLFRSKDMRDWTPVDVRFDFLSIPGADEEDYRLRFDPPKHRKSLAAKYMDSEIHHVAETFHIFTSLYGLTGMKRSDGNRPFGGSMWLRSTTGKPEGPYEYVDRARSQSSVFVDDDGSVYLFYNGTLERFDPRGSTLRGERRRLYTTAGTRLCAGDVATNLAKIHGKYMIFATGWNGATFGENERIDSTYDTVYWQSDTLEGPYEMPRRAYCLPHGGHSCPVMKGNDGRWYGLLFGNDATSPWWNYPGVLVYDVRLDADDTVRIELTDELP